MKKSGWFSVTFWFLLFVSCTGEEITTNEGDFNISGDLLDVQTSIIEDRGCFGNNCTYTIILTDGLVLLDDNGNRREIQNESYSLFADLNSPGPSFQTSFFMFDPNGSASNFFISDFIFMDESNNISEFIEGISGDITFEGSGNEFTITFNIDLDNGEQINGSYSGSFSRI